MYHKLKLPITVRSFILFYALVIHGWDSLLVESRKYVRSGVWSAVSAIMRHVAGGT